MVLGSCLLHRSTYEIFILIATPNKTQPPAVVFATAEALLLRFLAFVPRTQPDR